jgi:THO complex subunit 1
VAQRLGNLNLHVFFAFQSSGTGALGSVFIVFIEEQCFSVRLSSIFSYFENKSGKRRSGECYRRLPLKTVNPLTMTATIIQPVEDVTLRLDTLLKRARQLKQSDSIQPPLPASEFAGDLGLPPSDVSKRTHHSSVDIAAKRLLQSQLVSRIPNVIWHHANAHQTTIDIDSAEFGQIWNLLDIVQILGDQDQCEPVLLWYLIEDLLDSQSIDGCRSIFDYLESRRERLVAKNFTKVSLVILRACNELLRRLSRAEDAVFCGRVFIFVFQCFPLGDRSSVNRHGDYNSESVTTFDELPPKESSQATGEDTVMADAEPSSETKPNARESTEHNEDTTTSAIKDIDELYPVFWGLQKSFAYPPSVWDPALLENFKKGFEATLEKFKEMRNVLSNTNSEQRRGTKRKTEELEIDEFSNSFNPKYLTSRELFELEVRIQCHTITTSTKSNIAQRLSISKTYFGTSINLNSISTIIYRKGQKENGQSNPAENCIYTI